MMVSASASPSPSLDADRALLTDAVTDAGETAMRFFGREPKVWHKRPGDPVWANESLCESGRGRKWPDETRVINGLRSGHPQMNENQKSLRIGRSGGVKGP